MVRVISVFTVPFAINSVGRARVSAFASLNNPGWSTSKMPGSSVTSALVEAAGVSREQDSPMMARQNRTAAAIGRRKSSAVLSGFIGKTPVPNFPAQQGGHTAIGEAFAVRPACGASNTKAWGLSSNGIPEESSNHELAEAGIRRGATGERAMRYASGQQRSLRNYPPANLVLETVCGRRS